MNYEVCRIANEYGLSLAKEIVRAHFQDEDTLLTSPPVHYHERVAKAQDRINAWGIGAMLAWEVRDALGRLLGPGQILIQAGVYLRAARPANENEVVGFHRESMYGGPAGTWNVWIPIQNVDERNTLRYIPGSAEIPDEAIEVRCLDSPEVRRGSAGQRIGLLYAPKEIIGGVDLTQSAPMLVPFGNAAIFPGSLIHGAGLNRTSKIRFSLDMRVIAQRSLH